MTGEPQSWIGLCTALHLNGETKTSLCFAQAPLASETILLCCELCSVHWDQQLATTELPATILQPPRARLGSGGSTNQD